MSRVLRRLGFWILVPDTRRFGWDDRATPLSSAARFSTYSRRAEASPVLRTISNVNDQTIYNWRGQDRVDRGLQAGLTTADTAELAAAKKRIAELETELAIAARAVDLLKEETIPKAGTPAVEVIAAENRPVQVACRILGVSESVFYEQRQRPPSERAIRHAMLTDLITQVHAESHGTYGILRVHAELTMGRGVEVGHDQVGLLMRRAGLQGAAGRRKWKRIRPDNIATDLVERTFARNGPNQLWVTDITEHPTREGKVALLRSAIGPGTRLVS